MLTMLKFGRLERANEAHSQLVNGTNFNLVSINFSDSPKALDGGDLGWRKRNEIPSLFADTVSFMNINEVSQSLQTRWLPHH